MARKSRAERVQFEVKRFFNNCKYKVTDKKPMQGYK